MPSTHLATRNHSAYSVGPRTQRSWLHSAAFVLAVLHFVLGGLKALLAVGCAISTAVVGGTFAFVGFTVAATSKAKDATALSVAPGAVVSSFSFVLFVVFAVMAAMTIYSGLCIMRGKHRVYSMVVACLLCFSLPFGTALGVFTLIVLAMQGPYHQRRAA